MLTFVFDTETTGLIHNRALKLERQPEIIEFYGCLIDLETGEIHSETERLVKSSKPVSEEITKITGITNDDLIDCLPFSLVAGEIKDALENAPAVLAHNLPFDMDMVEIEFERLDQTIVWPKVKICTIEKTMHFKGHRLNLQNLHVHLFDERFKEAHRAKADVQALCRCAVELFRMGEI